MMNEPTNDETLIAAIEGDYSGMNRESLILTCKMLYRGRERWREEAELANKRLKAILESANRTMCAYLCNQGISEGVAKMEADRKYPISETIVEGL